MENTCKHFENCPSQCCGECPALESEPRHGIVDAARKKLKDFEAAYILHIVLGLCHKCLKLAIETARKGSVETAELGYIKEAEKAISLALAEMELRTTQSAIPIQYDILLAETIKSKK